MTFQQNLLEFLDGREVKSKEDWEERRKEVADIIWHEEYGYPLAVSEKVCGKVVEEDTGCACGHAVLQKVELSFDTPKGEFSFPFNFVAPTDGKKHPLIIYLSFRENPYSKEIPLEEIVDNGFALAHIFYEDVTSDDGNFDDKLAGCFERPTDGTGWGKLHIWAYGASRAADYLSTRPEVDSENMAVAGCSRLGKTAMVCGAADERFKFVHSIDSGCGGAALEQTKHEGGEPIESMNRNFPYWFCENRQKYAGCEKNMPFDQHFLAALVAPRYLAISSASLDAWADPYSEQLCAVAASPAWEIWGLRGYIGSDRPAVSGDEFANGHVAYFMRDGIHFMGRRDWLNFMAFIRKNM